jgi:hypothetical protein
VLKLLLFNDQLIWSLSSLLNIVIDPSKCAEVRGVTNLGLLDAQAMRVVGLITAYWADAVLWPARRVAGEDAGVKGPNVVPAAMHDKVMRLAVQQVACLEVKVTHVARFVDVRLVHFAAKMRRNVVPRVANAVRELARKYSLYCSRDSRLAAERLPFWFRLLYRIRPMQST